jgi:hypothetical protein
VHLAEAGIHSSEAIVLYSKSLDHGTWHTFHVSRKRTFILNKEGILAAEEQSGDGFSDPIGQKLALVALSFPHCQPLNTPHIKLGWYDKFKPNSALPVRAFTALTSQVANKVPLIKSNLIHPHQGIRSV